MQRIVHSVLLIFLAGAFIPLWAAPIHDAAAKGDLSWIAALIQVDHSVVNATDKDGATPLHYAAAAGRTAAIKALLDNKANVNAVKKNGTTALHVAAALGQKKSVEVLLDAGADPDIKDSLGRTPLTLARRNAHKQLAAMLAVETFDSSTTEALLEVPPSGLILKDVHGWLDKEDIRYIPLRALIEYGSGKVAKTASSALVCKLQGKRFRLKSNTTSAIVGSTQCQMSGSTTQVNGMTYIPIDLLDKIGWTWRPSPIGMDICYPGARDHLFVTQVSSRIRHLDSSDMRSKVQVGVWYITQFYADDRYGNWWYIISGTGSPMPSRGRYGTNDPKVIERQILEMLECGIDFIVIDDTNTTGVNDGTIDRNIRAWFDYMDSLPQQSRIPIAIAAGGELNQHSSKESWRKAVDYLWNTFANRPSYLRYNGKPVLNWYIEKDIWPDWDDSRWTIRKTYHLSRMDGQIKYGGWGFGSGDNPPPISECMSFHPGWSSTVLRKGGDLYRSRWINALKAGPKFVLLSDWNGWIEKTAIEDSDSWKDTYGDPAPSWYRLLTQGYVAAYKGELIDGFCYKDEGFTDIYLLQNDTFYRQTEYPHKIPVITLPSGMLARLYAQIWKP